MPYSKSLTLDRILGYHVSSIGTSHFCSLVDVVVGSLRFAVNNRNKSASQQVSNLLLQQLAPICIRDSGDKVSELSIFFSPKTVRVPSYLDMYEDLHQFLASAGMTPSQFPKPA